MSATSAPVTDSAASLAVAVGAAFSLVREAERAYALLVATIEETDQSYLTDAQRRTLLRTLVEADAASHRLRDMVRYGHI